MSVQEQPLLPQDEYFIKLLKQHGKSGAFVALSKNRVATLTTFGNVEITKRP